MRIRPSLHLGILRNCCIAPYIVTALMLELRLHGAARCHHAEQCEDANRRC